LFRVIVSPLLALEVGRVLSGLGGKGGCKSYASARQPGEYPGG